MTHDVYGSGGTYGNTEWTQHAPDEVTATGIHTDIFTHSDTGSCEAVSTPLHFYLVGGNWLPMV